MLSEKQIHCIASNVLNSLEGLSAFVCVLEVIKHTLASDRFVGDNNGIHSNTR